jgi:hypothetical protein
MTVQLLDKSQEFCQTDHLTPPQRAAPSFRAQPPS